MRFIYLVKKKNGFVYKKINKIIIDRFLFISWIDIRVSSYFKKLLDSPINRTHPSLVLNSKLFLKLKDTLNSLNY